MSDRPIVDLLLSNHSPSAGELILGAAAGVDLESRQRQYLERLEAEATIRRVDRKLKKYGL